MKTAVDADALLQAYAGAGARQRRAADAIEAALAEGVLVIPASEFARFTELISDQTAFVNPPDLEEIAALCNDYAAAANVDLLAVESDDLVAALALLREHDLPATELEAALSAAALRRQGVDVLIAGDAKRYEHFSFVDAAVV